MKIMEFIRAQQNEDMSIIKVRGRELVILNYFEV